MRISDWSSDVCSSDLLQHPTEGRMRSPAPVGSYSKTPLSIRRHAPRPGEHTQEILQEVGLDPAFIDSVLGQAKPRSEEHTSELQSLMRISYAVFCLKKKNNKNKTRKNTISTQI